MTQEEKQLLLKDLSARLPYGVKVRIVKHIQDDSTIKDCTVLSMMWMVSLEKRLEDIKPYLRPMSSMTEEELNECVCQSGIKDIECPNWQGIPKEKQFEARLNHAIAVFLTDSNNVDWLNAHHFDFRSLIERGLALEAPTDMYSTK